MKHYTKMPDCMSHFRRRIFAESLTGIFPTNLSRAQRSQWILDHFDRSILKQVRRKITDSRFCFVFWTVILRKEKNVLLISLLKKNDLILSYQIHHLQFQSWSQQRHDIHFVLFLDYVEVSLVRSYTMAGFCSVLIFKFFVLIKSFLRLHARVLGHSLVRSFVRTQSLAPHWSLARSLTPELAGKRFWPLF